MYTPHLCGRQDDKFRPFIFKEIANLHLVGKIQLFVSTGQQIGETASLQLVHYRRTDQPLMASHIDLAAFIHCLD